MRKKPHYSGQRSNNNNNNNNKRRFVRKPGGGGGGGRFGGGNEDSDFVNPRMRKQAQTNRDKYLAMAKDALSSGDRVESEYYLQHADHYLRIMNAIDAQFAPRHQGQGQEQGSTQAAEDGLPPEEMAGVGAEPMDYAEAPEHDAAEEEPPYDDNAGAQLASVLPAPKMAGV